MNVEQIVQSVFGLATQDQWELAQAVEQVTALRPRVVVEIGVYNGGSLKAWAQCATEDALLIGIDTDCSLAINSGDHRAYPTQRLEYVNGNSTDPATIQRVRSLLNNRPTADFLFIDGAHDAETVRADFVNYSRMVRRGGKVGFHDIGGNAAVQSVWNEMAERFPDCRHYFRTDQLHKMGIGMVSIPDRGPRNLKLNRIGVAVLTCSRPDWLRSLLTSIRETTPGGSIDGWSAPVRVFQDGPVGADEYRKVCEEFHVELHVLNPWGCVQNNAQFAFANTPEEWVWCIQDDCLIVPGYMENCLQVLWDCEETPAGEVVGLLQPPYHQANNLPENCPSRA